MYILENGLTFGGSSFGSNISWHLTDVCVAEGQKGIFDWVSMHLLLGDFRSTFTSFIRCFLLKHQWYIMIMAEITDR